MMSIIERITSRQARVGVIGLGYVGLPLVIEFCKAGFPVTGFDVDPAKVEMLGQGKSYIRHIESSSFAPFLNNKFRNQEANALMVTTDFSGLAQMDCIIICVPTPLNINREPDMKYVFNSHGALQKACVRDSLSFWNPPPIPEQPTAT